MADPSSWKRARKALSRRVRTSHAMHRVQLALYRAHSRLCFRTCRWEWHGTEKFRAALDAGTPMIITNWHGRLHMMPYAWNWKRWRNTMLTFDHPLAKAMAEAAKSNGMGMITLSGDNDAAGLKQAVRLLRRGECLGITPDGPKGPNRRLKPGVIELASMGGARIVLVSFSARRAIEMSTWDRYLVPMPFTRGVFVVHEEFFEVPRRLSEKDKQALTERIESALTALDARADQLAGRTSV